MIFSSAIAQEVAATGAAAAAPSPFAGLIPLLLIFVIFYFLLIRPQHKKYKEHQAIINAVKKGDQIVTGGGIHAKVLKVEDTGIVTAEIAEGVEVKLERSTIASVLTKPELVKPAKADKEAKQAARKQVANDN